MIDPKSVPLESRRMPLETRVLLKFDRFSGFISEYSSNISQGGMFIRTQSSEPVGTILDFGFRLGDGYELIHGRGEVVWVREQDESPERPAGMGIRFLDLNQESGELIRMMVENFVQQGGTPFDVAAEETQTPPPAALAPVPAAPTVQEDLPALELEAEPAPAAPPPEAPPALSEVPWPSFEPVFESPVAQPHSYLQSRPAFVAAEAPAARRRGWIFAVVGLAVLAAVGFTQQDRLRRLLSPAAPPPPSVPAAPSPAVPPPVEPATVPADSEPPAEASLPEASETSREPPVAAGPAATRVQSITWEHIAGGTEIVVRGDGVIRSGSYRQTRIDGGAPRELIRLIGIQAAYPKTEIPVATLQVRRIRIGYHQETSPPELHVVLDLAGPQVQVTLLEEENRQLRIRLKEPASP
jgi:uncharacterized protein (TIGR02266 family)